MCKGHERCNCHISIGGPYPDNEIIADKMFGPFPDQDLTFNEIFTRAKISQQFRDAHILALPNEIKIERIGYSDDELRAKAEELRDWLFDSDIDYYSDKIYSFLKEMWNNVQHAQK